MSIREIDDAIAALKVLVTANLPTLVEDLIQWVNTGDAPPHNSKFAEVSDSLKPMWSDVIRRDDLVEAEVYHQSMLRMISLRKAIYTVCEGYNIDPDVRKILETAMWDIQ